MLERHTHDDIPAVEWWCGVSASSACLRVEFDASVPHGSVHRSPAARAEWERMRAANPRLHDGPILSVDEFDAVRGVLRCRVDTYMNLAVGGRGEGREGVETGVRHLGVNALIVARDAQGTEHALVARRGAQTRVYQGMWELAPAGGVEVPPGARGSSRGRMPDAADPAKGHSAHDIRNERTQTDYVRRAEGGEEGEQGEQAQDRGGGVVLDEDELLRQLVREGIEELGVDLTRAAGTGPARVIGVTRDGVARSDCLVMRLDWPDRIDARSPLACPRDGDAWEYIDTAWVSRADAPAFARDARGVIGPTRAILRWWGSQP